MNSKLNEFCSKLFEKLYWIILILFLLSMFFNINRVAMIGGILVVLCIWIVSISGFVFFRNKIAILLFIFYCGLSTVVYIANDYAIYVFLSALAGSLLPMFLSLCPSTELYERFFDNTYIALVVGFVISIILYIFMPSFYIDYLFSKGIIGQGDLFWAQYFFQGIFGVTVMGTLSSCSSLFFLCKFVNEKRLTTMLFLTLSVVTLFLTLRRSAIAAFMFGVIVVALNTFIKKNIKITSKTLLWGTFVAVTLFLIIVNNDVFFISVVERVINISEAINERNGDWIANVEELGMIDSLFGMGYGSKSHTALRYGYMAVTDSSYIQLFCELGVIGIVIFGFIIFSLFYSIHLKRVNDYYLASLLVVFVYLIQAIGSNVFEFQSSSPLFWISIGYSMQYELKK